MRSEVQIFSFYFPCAVFSCPVHLRRNILAVTAPIIGIAHSDREWFQALPQFQKIFITPFPVMPCQNTTAHSFHCIPCPTLIAFATNKTPKFIHLTTAMYLYFCIITLILLIFCQQNTVYLRRFFFKVFVTVSL